MRGVQKHTGIRAYSTVSMTTGAADMLSQLSKDTCAHMHAAMHESALKRFSHFQVPASVGTSEREEKKKRDLFSGKVVHLCRSDPACPRVWAVWESAMPLPPPRLECTSVRPQT